MYTIFGGRGCDPPSPQQYVAPRGRDEARDDPEQRRLAAAGGPDDAEIVVANVDRHLVERCDGALPIDNEFLANVLQREEGRQARCLVVQLIRMPPFGDSDCPVK